KEVEGCFEFMDNCGEFLGSFRKREAVRSNFPLFNLIVEFGQLSCSKIHDGDRESFVGGVCHVDPCGYDRLEGRRKDISAHEEASQGVEPSIEPGKWGIVKDFPDKVEFFPVSEERDVRRKAPDDGLA